MSKIKNVLKNAIQGYFNLLAKSYDDRYYKYSCRMI